MHHRPQASCTFIFFSFRFQITPSPKLLPLQPTFHFAKMGLRCPSHGRLGCLVLWCSQWLQCPVHKFTSKLVFANHERAARPINTLDRGHHASRHETLRSIILYRGTRALTAHIYALLSCAFQGDSCPYRSSISADYTTHCQRAATFSESTQFFLSVTQKCTISVHRNERKKSSMFDFNQFHTICIDTDVLRSVFQVWIYSTLNNTMSGALASESQNSGESNVSFSLSLPLSIHIASCNLSRHPRSTYVSKVDQPFVGSPIAYTRVSMIPIDHSTDCISLYPSPSFSLFYRIAIFFQFVKWHLYKGQTHVSWKPPLQNRRLRCRLSSLHLRLSMSTTAVQNHNPQHPVSILFWHAVRLLWAPCFLCIHFRSEPSSQMVFSTFLFVERTIRDKNPYFIKFFLSWSFTPEFIVAIVLDIALIRRLVLHRDSSASGVRKQLPFVECIGNESAQLSSVPPHWSDSRNFNCLFQLYS